MKTTTSRAFQILLLVFLLPAFTGCSAGTGLDARFRDLSKAVHAYCNTAPSRRTPDAKQNLLNRFDAFEAELELAPAETRKQYHDKLVNQRCFVALAR
jgi:hypothetical protein